MTTRKTGGTAPRSAQTRYRRALRRLGQRWRELATALRIRRYGFFVPYLYPGRVQPVSGPYPAVEKKLAENHDIYRRYLSDMARHAPHLARAPGIDWTGGVFPQIDQIAAYSVLRRANPARVLEIGSGSSTLVLDKALKDCGTDGALTCIDPAPRRPIAGTGARTEQRMLKQEDAGLVSGLEPGDVLFIDSSHILLPGLDVDIQFNRMFPALKPGVLVHLHDIFLPDDYPTGWRGRFYSEQNALVGWLLSGYFDILLPCHYVKTRMHDEMSAALQDMPEIDPRHPCGSLWLRKSQT